MHPRSISSASTPRRALDLRVAARDELIKHADNKTWICRSVRSSTRGVCGEMRSRREDIQKWLVQNGWALSAVRFP